MSPQPEERRRHERIPIKISVQVRLMVPEETFTPQVFPALAVDMSASGLKVVTQHCPEQDYRRILKTVRHVRIDATLPGSDREMAFRGRIVWVDLDNQVTPSLLQLGIAFDTLDEDQHAALRKSIDTIRRGRVEGIQPASRLPHKPPTGSK